MLILDNEIKQLSTVSTIAWIRVYAAGDCTNSIDKQIIISMGSGATAALGAFDYIIRN